MSPVLIWRLPVLYALAQVLTGVEVGTAAAVLVIGLDLSLPAALGLTFPLGLPMVSGQLALLIWLTAAGPCQGQALSE